MSYHTDNNAIKY